MVNSLSCPKMSNSQTCPDLSNSSSMSDLNLSGMMGMINSQSGLVLGPSSLSGMSMPEDCKPPEVKLEVLDELFGSGWDDHGLSMAASPSSESSMSPSPPSTYGSTNSYSASLMSAASQHHHLSLKSTSTLLAVSSSPPEAVMAAARNLKMPLSGDFLSTFASSLNGFTTQAPASVMSAAMAGSDNLHIIIPSTTPGPDTTSSNAAANAAMCSFKSPTSETSSAESSGSAKKTVFTAKGKTVFSSYQISDSTNGRAGASYPKDQGSSPASAMLQRALRLLY